MYSAPIHSALFSGGYTSEYTPFIQDMISLRYIFSIVRPLNISHMGPITIDKFCKLTKKREMIKMFAKFSCLAVGEQDFLQVVANFMSTYYPDYLFFLSDFIIISNSVINKKIDHVISKKWVYQVGKFTSMLRDFRRRFPDRKSPTVIVRQLRLKFETEALFNDCWISFERG